MFGFITKSVVVSVLWRKYRRLLVSTGLLFLFYFFVSMVHDDFLEYSLVSDTKGALAWAYIVKWLLFGVGALLYYVFNFPLNRRIKKGGVEGLREPNVGDAEKEEGKPSKPDPFDNIRRKGVLKSKSDHTLSQ